MNKLSIIGAGLAGCEAALQAASRDVFVDLYEMRPDVTTGAHTTDEFAELVCSNSLGSNLPTKAPGLLKEELRILNSYLIEIADSVSIPAGSALAVDRSGFSNKITQAISAHPNIQIHRKEVFTIPEGPVIIATGPLTSPGLSNAIHAFTGESNLLFHDALAPIVSLESIDMSIAFRASRYGNGINEDGDYINCPFNQEQYDLFVEEIQKGKRTELKSFEKDIDSGVSKLPEKFFEACLPVEIIASRGQRSLAFGPMRPVGLTNPHSDERPYAVIQLRQDNLANTLYNIVGFQTNLTFSEQKRIFRMIPGLENAEFIRYGQMHRNTFILSPEIINSGMQSKKRNDLFFAGQISGSEGYSSSIATGLLAGVNAVRYINNQKLIELPNTTMLGALCHYIANASIKDFQPMKPNFGIVPPLEPKPRSKRIRYQKYHARAIEDLIQYLEEISIEENL
ncbi:MAG: methylenetetrahydrofolate--tRNA-(uracil(54)-C(5))-methyltransferase (FADH(2)-oxidizing) TrmFO [Bacteroidales bacterium]|nr:methylenetetrahydrofolate--tRNA-(uracil(54)-C(5))-methyltransferase (FADH(2)-oxidizing) TrmFO [Bacteroidales bacterium]